MSIAIATNAPRAIAEIASPAVVMAHALTKTLDERPILKDLSFSIPQGRFIALLGANGAGKTTLLNMLATLTTPTSGQLRLFGRAARRDDPSLRSRIGFVSHRSMLYRELTALENLVFFGKLYRAPKPRSRARELLEYVGLLDRADDAVGSFSRGMTQRVAIARALMRHPDLLLADEPFAGLDAPSTRAIETIMQSLNEHGATIVMANHNIAQSVRLADRVIALRHGAIALTQHDPSEADLDKLLKVIDA